MKLCISLLEEEVDSALSLRLSLRPAYRVSSALQGELPRS